MRAYLAAALVSCLFAGQGWLCAAANPKVDMKTNLGDIVIELYPQQAPITADNFLTYVKSGFYDGLLFHRVISDFMIQGGGYYLNGQYIYTATPASGPIINESYNGLRNLRGTLAMARTNQPHSATSQFYINHIDNPHLDRQNALDGYGYCVFGRVVEGMDVVDAIAQVQTCYVNASLANFPCNPPVWMEKVSVRPCEGSYDSDFNIDKTVDFADFAKVASHWLDDVCGSADGFCGGADLNYSGRVDLADLELFLIHWNRPVGYEPQASDLVPGGQIDIEDFLHLVTHWLDGGCTVANSFCGGADINRSGKVDSADAALLCSNWLTSY